MFTRKTPIKMARFRVNMENGPESGGNKRPSPRIWAFFGRKTYPSGEIDGEKHWEIRFFWAKGCWPLEFTRNRAKKHWRFRVKPASLGQGAAASARALPPRSGRCRCPAPAAFLPLSSPPASNKKPRAMAYVPVNRGPRFSLPYPRRRLLPGFWRRYTVTPLDKSASRRAPKYRS